MKTDQEWLDSLQIGDEVAVAVYGVMKIQKYRLTCIKKISPTRRLTTEDDQVFKSNGEAYGSTGLYSSTYRMLVKPTEEIKEHCVKAKLVEDVICLMQSIKDSRGAKLMTLEIDRLKEVSEVLKGI